MNICGYCGKETSNLKFCCISCNTSYHNKSKPQNQKKPENLILSNCIVCGSLCKSAKSVVCSYTCSGELKKIEKEKRYKAIFDQISKDFYSDQFLNLHQIANKNSLDHYTIKRAIKFLGVKRKLRRIHTGAKKVVEKRQKKHPFQLPVGMEPKSLGGIWDVEITVRAHPAKYGFYSTNTIWNT